MTRCWPFSLVPCCIGCGSHPHAGSHSQAVPGGSAHKWAADVFLFCNRKKNCLKALRFDKDGFLPATKNCFRTWFFNGQSRKKRSGTSRPNRSDGCWKAYLSNRRKPIRQYGSVRKIRASKVRENAGKIVWIPCKISIFQAFSG